MHTQVVVFSDASLYKYEGQVKYEGEVIEITDFWEQGNDIANHLRRQKQFSGCR